jgi:hypothetical protein
MILRFSVSKVNIFLPSGKLFLTFESLQTIFLPLGKMFFWQVSKAGRIITVLPVLVVAFISSFSSTCLADSPTKPWMRLWKRVMSISASQTSREGTKTFSLI